MMKALTTWTVIFLILLTSRVLGADQLDDDLKRLTMTQSWVGKNGKSIRALFIKRDGDQIHLLTEKGKKLEVALSNLSQTTQTWFYKAWAAKLEREGAGGKGATPADGAKLYESRVWHSTNGKHIRGKFVDRDGDVIRLADSRGKMYKVPLTSLSDEDRAWFNKVWEGMQKRKTVIKGLMQPGQVQLLKEKKLPSVAPIGYTRVPEGKVVRLNIPQIDQSEYHDKDFNNMESSMVPFMLWWHNYKVVETSVTRDDSEKRVKWLYKTLNKLDLDRRRINGMQFQQFFQKEVKTSACFQIKDLRDGREVFSQYKTLDRFSPEFLSQYTQGANATILSLPVYKKGRKEWTAEVPLVECTINGNVVFYMYGNIKLTGKLEKIPFDKKQAQKRGDKLPRYEIKIDNMGDAPDWFREREYTFFLEGKDDAGLTVIVPNLVEKLDEEEDK